MNVKDIYLKIDNLITEQHRSLKSFCANTNRSYSSLARTMSETIYNGKGAHLVTTEEILNDLGYELTIQKKRKEVWDGNKLEKDIATNNFISSNINNNTVYFS